MPATMSRECTTVTRLCVPCVFTMLLPGDRAGVALLEIVTEPCIRSADEAGAFLKKLQVRASRAGYAPRLCQRFASSLSTLQGLLRHVGVCDGNMEEGSMRCDVNVSVRPALDDGSQDAPRLLGQRVEMKNLNSVRHVVNAVEFEAARQIEILEVRRRPGGGACSNAAVTGVRLPAPCSHSKVRAVTRASQARHARMMRRRVPHLGCGGRYDCS